MGHRRSRTGGRATSSHYVRLEEPGRRSSACRTALMPRNDLVEARVIELREDPNLLGDRTDLAYLRVFQDIYVWAGICGRSASRRRAVLSARGRHQSAMGMWLRRSPARRSAKSESHTVRP